MILCLDLDGVIANIQDEINLRLQKDFDVEPSYDWNTYYIEDRYPDLPADWLDNQFADPTFWLNAKCYEDAWNMVNKWFMTSNDVFIATCRDESTLEVTERWLDEWEINYNKLFVNQTRLEKYKVCHSIGADIFIDDDPHEINIASLHVPSYLRSHPYNDSYDIGAGFKLKSLYDLDKLVSAK